MTARKKVVVVCNRAAGTAAKCDDPHDLICKALRAAGAEAEVRGVPGPELAQAAKEAAADPSVDVVVAAGGDGTVSAVAGALVGSGRPMGVLPMGTLNHFAKDLGIPLELEEAARVIVEGAPLPVDTGEVNGRVFVNNSQIGLYPKLVRKRTARARWLGKWVAAAVAAFELFRRIPLIRVRLHLEDVGLHRTTPFVFVGNNCYDASERTRARLDAGVLCLFVASRTTKPGLLALALRAVFGRLDERRDLHALSLREVRIDARKRHLDVAADGEVIRMRPPLRYRVRPRSLRVIVPREPRRPPASPAPA